MKKLATLAPLSMLVLGGTAHAAVPEAVTDAIEAAGADGITAATAVLVAIIGVWAIKFIKSGLGR